MGLKELQLSIYSNRREKFGNLWRMGQGDISQVSLKACFFGANCPVGTKNIPTGQIAPKKYALRLTWEMSAWEMSPCLYKHIFYNRKMIYSERSWKMEHFLLLQHVLNRFSFWDNCVWNFEFVYKLFVVIHKLFWIFCRKIDFCINFLNFHKMNIVAIFYS